MPRGFVISVSVLSAPVMFSCLLLVLFVDPTVAPALLLVIVILYLLIPRFPLLLPPQCLGVLVSAKLCLCFYFFYPKK